MRKYLFLLIPAFAISCITSCAAPKIVEKLEVSGKEKIEIGETTQFIGKVTPSPKEEDKVKWTTSNPDVAYIDDDGNVTGVTKGVAKITGTYGGKLESKNVYIGGYIEHPVESISLNGQASLKVGEYTKIDATILPNDATNKDIVWSISNPDNKEEKRLSIFENGIIKGEYPGEVKVTATTKDGNKSSSLTINVTAKEEKSTIKSFSKPDCVLHYNDVIKNLETNKFDESIVDRNNSKNYMNNKFFPSDKEKQIYKVGSSNPFKFKCNITTSVKGDEFKEVHDDNPYQKCELIDSKGEIVTNQYLTSTYKGNEYQFNKSAEGKTFTLRSWADSDYYENGFSTYQDAKAANMVAELEIKVIDGYNAYDFAGLTAVDNWSIDTVKTTKAKERIDANEYVDLWGSFKEKNHISNPQFGYPVVILHNDIQIKTDDLPEAIRLTEQEVSEYVNGTKNPKSSDYFNSFVETKAAIHQEEWKNLPNKVIRAKCINLMNNSRKDGTSIFTRYLDKDFTFEGNYFTIDESKVKPVVFFDDKPLLSYYLNLFHFDGLFCFGVTDRAHYWKNISDPEMNMYDSFRPCGFIDDQHTSIKTTVNNLRVIGNGEKNGTHDEGMGGDNIFINNYSCGEYNNVIVTSAYRSFLLSCDGAGWGTSYLSVNNSKCYDNFSEFVFMDKSKDLRIKDSFMKDASGCGIKPYEDRERDNYQDIKLENSYIECFVSGREIANKNNGFSLLINLIAQTGYQAFEKFKNEEFGTEKIKGGKSFVFVEDKEIFINLVVFQAYSQGINQHSMPKLKMTAGKTGEDTVIDMYKDGTEESSPIHYYHSLPLANVVGGLTFKSTVGGHATLPLKDVVEPNDLEVYDPDLPKDVPLVGKNTLRMSTYLKDRAYYDQYYPNVGNTMGKLFEGDYLACYLKPSYFHPYGLVLGCK